MLLTSRYRFAASHRLDLPELSPEENLRIFGKCNNPYGHGHDYAVEITVDGPVDSDGLVVKRSEIDALVRQKLIALLDHKNLNCDVEGLAGINPTTENLAAFMHKTLTRHWTLEARLARITIIETPKNTFSLEVPRES